ncbi:MAG TPA: hypothetical protein VII00_03585 [bacterium]
MRTITKIFMPIFIIILASGQCANVAPYESTISITPDGVDLQDTFHEYLNQQFVITVTDKDDVPLNGVEITISFIFAPNYSCPVSSCLSAPIIELVDKDNNVVNSPFTTTTGEDGTYTITTRIYSGSWSFVGDLEVRSGATGFNSVEIKVNQ